MCHIVSQCDTMTQNKLKIQKKPKICKLIIEIDVTYKVVCRRPWNHFLPTLPTTQTFDTSVTPKVCKLNGLSKDGRGHSRGAPNSFIGDLKIFLAIFISTYFMPGGRVGRCSFVVRKIAPTLFSPSSTNAKMSRFFTVAVS
jgi:hypothetical protein